MEALIVLIIALIVFGPKRLPELGSSLGRGLSGFRKGLAGEQAAASPEVAARPRDAQPGDAERD